MSSIRETLEAHLLASRKRVTEAQKELRIAHEAIAEYEANEKKVFRKHRYYVQDNSTCAFTRKVGDSIDIIGFMRIKRGKDKYDEIVRCVINGDKVNFVLTEFLRLIGEQGEGK